jgi:catechol 2,3-dioxygenase-like lactoylglutathione lyase family enzyme
MPLEFSREVIEVGIVTGDPERALTFYRDFLGFPYLNDIRFPGGCYHRLAIGESVLKIIFLEAQPAPTRPVGGGPTGGAGGFRYVSFPIENLEEIVSEAGKRGYKVAVPVNRHSPTVAYAFLEDPDGNWIELFHSV